MDLIYLNGASSSGKTSIARELQNLLPENYLYLGIDAFMNMMPERSNDWDVPGTADGFSWNEVVLPDGKPGMRVVAGEYGTKVEGAFRDVVVTLLRADLRLIVDNVIDGKSEQLVWKDRLAGFDYCFAGVICSLEELERRESRRDDRIAGSAAEQYHRTHREVEYDVTVDTGKDSSETCAKQIMDHINGT
jgi:chloramphenicol 3-O phosphotransferase